MTIQIQSRAPAEIAKGTSLISSSNGLEINGRERQVERICINDPSKLDALILHYSDVPEKHTMLSVAVLVAFAVVVIGSIAAGILISPAMVPLILFPGYLAIAAPIEYLIRRERNVIEQRAKDLEVCQEAMRTERFCTFAKATFERSEFSVDELLKAHALFKDALAIQEAARKFEEKASQLAKKSDF